MRVASFTINKHNCRCFFFSPSRCKIWHPRAVWPVSKRGCAPMIKTWLWCECDALRCQTSSLLRCSHSTHESTVRRLEREIITHTFPVDRSVDAIAGEGWEAGAHRTPKKLVVRGKREREGESETLWLTVVVCVQWPVKGCWLLVRLPLPPPAPPPPAAAAAPVLLRQSRDEHASCSRYCAGLSSITPRTVELHSCGMMMSRE